jgi:hypothetical protein
VTVLSDQGQRLCDEAPASYDDLRALFVNCTLEQIGYRDVDRGVLRPTARWLAKYR